eukprot:353695-Chlamydomonas_euryale.AAC.2
MEMYSDGWATSARTTYSHTDGSMCVQLNCWPVPKIKRICACRVDCVNVHNSQLGSYTLYT